VQKILGDKVAFFRLFQDFDLKKLYSFDSSSFLPETFVFDLSTSIFSEEESLSLSGVKNFWILKSPSGYGGEGIQVIRSIEDVKSLIVKLK
jgi:hypothetical protein